MELSSIQPIVQQIAQTISSVLNLDTEIVDNKLVILGGTGKYAQEIGKQEENGLVNGPFLYGRVLLNGMSHIIEDTSTEDYDPDSLNGNPDELAEICCPIRKDENILGIIALVALTTEQKQRLLEKKTDYLTFIQRMAFLLVSKISEEEAKHKAAVTAKEMEVALSGVDQGILLIDEIGRITYYNKMVPLLLLLNKEEIIAGKNVSDFWPFSPIMRVLDSNEKFVKHVEVTGRNQQLIITALPIIWQEKIIAAVVYLKEETSKNVSSLSAQDGNYSFDHIIGHSGALSQLKEKALRVSQSNATILLTGESGTGKELFAKAIHGASMRRCGPFVHVNCGAIPENLMESEFFGYEGGAFTGAREKGKPGKFEQANNGTLFLDEIGDLALHLQVKLLHVLENRTIDRVGGNSPIDIDVRIIAATNRNLEKMIQNGKFREDLYFRLSIIPLHLPPLRERKEDLKDLLGHFIQKHAAELGKTIKGLTPESLSAFQRYNWPGNARELENAVAYCVNMETKELIYPENLPSRITQQRESTTNYSLCGSVEVLEREILLGYLEDRSNFQTKAEIARMLNISRTTLYRKLKRLGIET